MEEPKDDRGRLPGGAYVLAGISFFPLLGVPFGAAAILWGLLTKRRGGKTLAALGAGGIAFTVCMYGGLFYFGFVQRGGVFDRLRGEMAQRMLNDLVPVIEMYRDQHGQYPDSLIVLQRTASRNSFVSVFDPMSPSLHPHPFFYERIDDSHYELRGVGADGKLFTSDDLVPSTQPRADGTGLVMEHRPAVVLPRLTSPAAGPSRR